MTIPPSNSTDPHAKAALERLNQLKSQLSFAASPNSKLTTEDMTRERQAADFNIEEVAKFWAGGQDKLALKRKAYALIQTDPELVVQPPRNFLELSREEMREFTMGQVCRMAEVTRQLEDKTLASEVLRAVDIYSESFSMRIGVHTLLFRNVVSMLGNDDQKKHWMPLVDDMRIIGCFAMTELGHSSALRGLETTATYDMEADEFIIESPTITSSKWWIGMAGHTATHTVVIAQTTVQGKHCGLNWFIVQLRDLKTGELMPNVMAGDVGSKVGHQGVDNGWIQFRKTRVPRSQMLSKWVQLERNGTFHPAPNPAVMYGTLIPERIGLVVTMIQMVSQSVTIATRYGVVRRQGHKNQQIMDYQSHYTQLLPAVSFMYMVKASFETLDDQFAVLTSGGNMDEATYLNHMGDLHALSAALKSMVGWHCSDILETCRRSMGGHAYSAYNAIGHTLGDWGVFTTGGGDHYPLLQQTARVLRLRLVQQLDRGISPKFKFKSSAHFIQHAKKYLAVSQWDVDPAHLQDCLKDFSILTQALHIIIIKRLHTIEQAVKKGASEDDMLMDSVRVAELFAALFLFEDNAERFGRTKPHTLEASAASILHRLTGLWGLYVLIKYADQGIREHFLHANHVNAADQLYKKLCKDLRYQLIGLTDGFDYPDFLLKSPLGKHNGDIYTAYFETVLQAPNVVGVPAYFERYIKPLTDRS